jgi:hypothetical protein
MSSLASSSGTPGTSALPSAGPAWIGNGVLDSFLEDESLFGEFLRTPVSEGAVRHYESGIRV